MARLVSIKTKMFDFVQTLFLGATNLNFIVQQSFVGAIAVADLVKTTLGPKGMDKILQSLGDEHSRKKITVTNDGATIL